MKGQFRSAFAGYLGVDLDKVHLFWKGRVALYAILKALGVGPQDEVIIPAFTCVVVVNPIMYLGAKPVYVDIDPLTYNMDVDKIENKITPKTRVIVAQNTFGLSPDMDKIKEIATTYGLMVVEDCAHGLGGYYKGRKNGTLADASFFSTQWNKPFSTGLGGIAYSQNIRISQILREFEEEWAKPTVGEELSLRLLLWIRKHLLRGRVYWTALKTYRWLSDKDLILGSSQGHELKEPFMPKDFLKVLSDTQAREGIRGIRELDALIEYRRKVAFEYNDLLRELGISPPFVPDEVFHTYLKYPVLVRDKRQFLRAAVREGVPLGDWFASPLHPIEEELELWGYRWGENPVAEKISRHIVNLPTDNYLGKNQVECVREFLKRNRRNLFDNVEECLRS